MERAGPQPSAEDPNKKEDLTPERQADGRACLKGARPVGPADTSQGASLSEAVRGIRGWAGCQPDARLTSDGPTWRRR